MALDGSLGSSVYGTVTGSSRTALTTLEARLGHTFADKALLARALTHGSAATAVAGSYQRLEFLGDRVLALVISEMLIDAFPAAPEGELSRRLSDLVRKESCAAVAAELRLGEALRTGGSKAQARAIQTVNVMGDVCEAVIAAIYLDGGLEAARRFIEANWRERLMLGPKPFLNAKATFQEWAQGHGHPPPVYTIVERTGPDHSTTFEVEVTVPGMQPARGTGRTRREAEQDAARAVLHREGIWKAVAGHE